MHMAAGWLIFTEQIVLFTPSNQFFSRIWVTSGGEVPLDSKWIAGTILTNGLSHFAITISTKRSHTCLTASPMSNCWS